MAVVAKPVSQSYWDILPIEIQDFIFELRDEILKKERDVLIRSLSEEEIFKALGYRYDNILTESTSHDYTRACLKIANSVYKIHGRIFRVTSHDIGNIMEGIDLIVNLERNQVLQGQPDEQEGQIIAYWDSIDDVEQCIEAARCFDVMSTNDIEQLRSRDNDYFIHFAEYCFDIFRDIYNNRESN
jgi:HEPN domain-containing protein